MGDSSLVTWLSAAPLFVILVSIVAAVLAWRSGRRVVRAGVALLLIVVGAAIVFFPVELLFSIAGGAVIFLLGVVLLIVEYRPGSVV